MPKQKLALVFSSIVLTGLPLLIGLLYLVLESKPVGDYGTHELMVIFASIAMSFMMARRVKDGIKQLKAR